MIECEGFVEDLTCQVINARLFEATDTAARFLFSSQDTLGNPVTGSGTVYYRPVGTTTWMTATQAAMSTSYNVLVTGLTSGTLYEWYAEVELPDGSTCVSSTNQFMTEGGVVNPPTDCTVCIENGAGMWEIENIEAFGGWIEQPANANTSGPWYSWQGGNNFFLQEAGEDILKYTVDIKQAGNYIFKIHSFSDTSADPTRPDLANDAWVRFPTGVDVAGEVDAQQGWIKVFRNGSFANQWTWLSSAEHLGNQWVQTVQFFSAGTHCIEISGRSNGHGIDRFALCQVGAGIDPASLPASPLINCGNATKTLPTTSLYDPGCDLIALHYDVAPDLDDLHAIAAGCSLSTCFNIDPCVVIGTYGLLNGSGDHMDQYLNDTNHLGQTGAPYQGNVTRRQMAIDVATASFGSNGFIDTGDGWTAAVNAAAAKWKPVLQSGCDVWVQEGGPMDFTAGVLLELQSQGCTAAELKRVHIIQHANFNITQTLANNFNTVQNLGDYILIPNGNLPNNGSADLEDVNVNTTNSTFAVWARNSACAAGWNAALDRFSAKVDFSDTVEYLYILGIGTGTINTLQDFCDYVD